MQRPSCRSGVTPAPTPHRARCGSPAPVRRPVAWSRRPPEHRRRRGCGRNGASVRPPASSPCQVDPRLGVDRVAFEVHPRRLDGRAGVEAVVDDADDRSRTLTGSAGARAAKHQLDLHGQDLPTVGAIIDGIRPARWRGEEAQRAGGPLPHHVVEVDARPGHDETWARRWSIVTAHALPSPSSTETCVVDLELGVELRRPRRLCAGHRIQQRRRRDVVAVEPCQRDRQQRPARRRRKRVGDDRAAPGRRRAPAHARSARSPRCRPPSASRHGAASQSTAAAARSPLTNGAAPSAPKRRIVSASSGERKCSPARSARPLLGANSAAASGVESRIPRGSRRCRPGLR